MQATALITHEGPTFACEDIILPDPRPDQIAVQTRYSGVSIGTEFAAITRKLNYGPYPLCTGYQAVGTGVLPWHHTITHEVASSDAPKLYRDILNGEAKSVIGAVIRWF